MQRLLYNLPCSAETSAVPMKKRKFDAQGMQHRASVILHVVNQSNDGMRVVDIEQLISFRSRLNIQSIVNRGAEQDLNRHIVMWQSSIRAH